MLDTRTSSLEAVRFLVEARLARVEETLLDMAPAGYEPIDVVNDYLLNSTGKLIRPTLVLLCNEIGGQPSEEATRLAAIVELLHVATLVHDDAVDHSVTRRGKATVSARWTHQVAIIMGDYLYSRAVIEITALGDVESIALLARTANRMTVGEMRQLMAHDALGFTRDDYFLLCDCKTATLIATACELGALAGDARWREPLREYGFQLGMCFQIIDDLLDYTSPTEVLGKPCGQDLREHKVTLPLIEALPRLGLRERANVNALFAEPEPADDLVVEVIENVRESGGLDSALEEAWLVAGKARAQLEELPASVAKDALDVAVDYVVERVR